MGGVGIGKEGGLVDNFGRFSTSIGIKGLFWGSSGVDAEEKGTGCGFGQTDTCFTPLPCLFGNLFYSRSLLSWEKKRRFIGKTKLEI